MQILLQNLANGAICYPLSEEQKFFFKKKKKENKEEEEEKKKKKKKKQKKKQKEEEKKKKEEEEEKKKKKCNSLPPSWPAQISQYGISYLLHAVSCTSQIWMSLWFTILHCSFLIPFWFTQGHSTAARSITSLKLLWKIMLCSCHRLWFDKWLHYCNAVLHWPLLHLNHTPNIIWHGDGQYGSAM